MEELRLITLQEALTPNELIRAELACGIPEVPRVIKGEGVSHYGWQLGRGKRKASPPPFDPTLFTGVACSASQVSATTGRISGEQRTKPEMKG